MPLYDYECKSCEHQVLDVKQGFNDEPLTLCPKCNKEELFRIVTGGLHASVKKVETIGQLADKNTKANKNLIAENIAKKKEETPEAPKAWYENKKYGDATSKEINKMSANQVTRYIMEGRK